MIVPIAMTAPPSQSQTIIVLIRMPIVTRPLSSAPDTRVRYTSSTTPVRTDGVPMPSLLFGNVEMLGV